MRLSPSTFAGFCLGAFTTVSQTALLREYLVLFRGSELAIGFFFFAWFIWVAVGAVLFKKSKITSDFIEGHAYTLLSLYPLAGLLGLLLVISVRFLFHVKPYEFTPNYILIIASFMCNSLISILTGCLFPAICRIFANDNRDAANKIYVVETLGAVFGGCLATLMYYLGVNGVMLISIVSILPITHGLISLTKQALVFPIFSLFMVLSVILPFTGVMDVFKQVRLSSNLSNAELSTEVETPYRLVTTATIQGQTVVLINGSVSGSFPIGPDIEVMAGMLASQPKNRERALLLGMGKVDLGICLSRYFREVEWVSEDKKSMNTILKAFGKDNNALPNLKLTYEDPRVFVRNNKTLSYDLVVVVNPEPESLLANRLWTFEFFLDVKELMGDSVLVLFVTSAENYLGTEKLRYGQTLYQTLSRVFPDVQIVPGEQAIFLASPRLGILSLEFSEIQKRFLAFAPKPLPFDPNSFKPLFLPERIDFIGSIYKDTAHSAMVNQDTKPMAIFLYLLSMLKESDSAGIKLLWALKEGGSKVLIAFLIILLFAFLRTRLKEGGGYSNTYPNLLMAIAGGSSIGSSITIIFAYQTYIGAIYGEIGGAIALSMAGMAFGTKLFSHIRLKPLLYCTISSLAMLVIGFLSTVLSQINPILLRVILGFCIFLCGFITGGAWAVVSFALKEDEVSPSLVMYDHFGSALASGLLGVLILSIFGVFTTFLFMAGLFAICTLLLLTERFMFADEIFLKNRIVRTLISGSLPFGISSALLWIAGLTAILLYHSTLSSEYTSKTQFTSEEIAQIDLCEREEFKKSPFPHYILYGTKDPIENAFLLTSSAVGVMINGYGGPLVLAISVSIKGIIRKVTVLHHNETPSYVSDLSRFLAQFKGRDIRHHLSLRGDIDAITGATVTSEAIVEGINKMRQEIGEKLLGIKGEQETQTSVFDKLSNPYVIYGLFFLLSSVIVFLWGGKWMRTFLLSISLLFGGVILNMQLSTTWLQMLAKGNLPSFSNDLGMFIITIGFILLAFLFGPLYCSHVCPFGALQEWFSYIGRCIRLMRRQPKGWNQKARAIKYLLLVLVVFSILSADPHVFISWDPLASVFSGGFSGVGWVVVLFVVIGSLFFFRFYCRIFCPVGAFFLLFNRIALALSLHPRRRYNICDLEVSGPQDGECLQCNRCLRGSICGMIEGGYEETFEKVGKEEK